MAGIDTVAETSLPPDAVRAALLDFTPQRPDIWPGIAPSLYEVYEVGQTSAVVKEGSKVGPFGEFWARELYDWSDADTIRWTVVESNFSEPGSYLTATLRPREDGGTRVEIHWDRRPTTAGARILMWVIRMTGGKPISGSFRRGLEILERRAQSSAATTTA